MLKRSNFRQPVYTKLAQKRRKVVEELLAGHQPVLEGDENDKGMYDRQSRRRNSHKVADVHAAPCRLGDINAVAAGATCRPKSRLAGLPLYGDVESAPPLPIMLGRAGVTVPDLARCMVPEDALGMKRSQRPLQVMCILSRKVAPDHGGKIAIHRDTPACRARARRYIITLISYQNTDIMIKPLKAKPLKAKPFRPRAPAAAAPIPLVGEGKRGASGHLAYLLRQASAAVRLKLERSFAEFDVTLPQFSVLTMIAAYQPVSGADLARLTLLTPQTINVITRNLAKRGAITKQPDAIHGRIIRLQITDVGRRLLRSCKSRSDRIGAGLTTTLSAAEERIVRGWLIEVAKDMSD